MTTKEFIEKALKDDALRAKLAGCKSPEEAYAVAKEAGLSDGLDAFTAVMTAAEKRVSGELSDEELRDIAGGFDWGDVGTIIAGGAAVTATVSTAAAA